MGEMNHEAFEDGSSPLLGLEAIERELAAGARSGSPDPHPASPFLASLEERPELERLDQPGTAEMAVATFVDAEEDMAEVDEFAGQVAERAGAADVEVEEGGPTPEAEIEFLDEIDRKSRGYAVWAQQSLNQLANAGLTVDGYIGPLSRLAIKRFQAAHGLTADGIIGAKTEAALSAAGAAPPPGSTVRPTPGGSTDGVVQTPATVTGAAIPISVPALCVDVPPLVGPDQGCAGVDSTKFAGIAEVATFAAGIADCYSNRMAGRRQRERHSKAQDEAARLAKSVRIPNETPTVRAQRIAAARAAVQPEPVESVRTLIRTKYLEFLEEEFRDTITGANNRWGRRCQLRSVARMWMFGVREQLDFLTLGTSGRSLEAFAPPPKSAAGDQLVDIEPPATTSGGAKVQPIMNTFLRELRSRAPRHSAYNYPGHGGGSFNGRGYSIDLELSSPKDERGFYQRPAAVRFLLAVDDAARAAGVQWRAIYNDYAVAAAVNRHLDRRRVVFVGQPRRGGRQIGLNWHGPLILHFHLDITPQSQSPDREEEDLPFSILQEAEESHHVGVDGSTDEDLAAEDPEAYEPSDAASAETLTDLEEPASHLHTAGAHDLEDDWVGAAEELDSDKALALASPDEEQTFGPDEVDTALFEDEQAGAAPEGPGIGTLDMLLEVETGAGSSLADRVQAVAAFALGPTLRRGSGGPAVAALQRALASLGYDVAVDGAFGANTERAVRAVQGRLHIAADGVVGPRTKAAIASALSGRSPAASVRPKRPMYVRGAGDITAAKGTGRQIDVSRATRYITVACPSQKTNDEWKKADPRRPLPLPVYNDYALMKVMYTLRLIASRNTRLHVNAFQYEEPLAPLDFSGLQDSDVIFIAGHGDAQGLFTMGPDRRLGQDRLVDILTGDGNLKKHRKGKKIIIMLLSCRAGLGFHKGLARRLARRLSIDTIVGGAQGFTFGSLMTQASACNEVLIRGIPWVMEFPGSIPLKEAENETSARERKIITYDGKRTEIERFLSKKKSLEGAMADLARKLRSTEVNKALDEIDARFRSEWGSLLQAQFELYGAAKQRSNLEFDMWFQPAADGYLWTDSRKITDHEANALITGTLTPPGPGLTCTR
jgi:peptidoglycan hydrolase-like protein with peptidoglycan-binding domain